MEKYWNRIKSALKGTIPLHSFRMWIEPLVICRDAGETLFIECPNVFSLRRVQDQYSQKIREEFKRLTGKDCQFRVANGQNTTSFPVEALAIDPQRALPDINRHASTGRFLRRDFTFDQFVVGRNNDFAYSASLSLASSRQSPQNCLFLLSNTGVPMWPAMPGSVRF